MYRIFGLWLVAHSDHHLFTLFMMFFWHLALSISGFTFQGEWPFFQSDTCFQGKNETIRSINARPYISRQHCLTATQQNGLNRPSILHFVLLTFFFLLFFCLSVQLGINYVCCCKFSLFTTGSGLTGTVVHWRPFRWDCSKAKNEPCSSKYFLLKLFNEMLRGEENMALCLFSSVHSVSLSFSAVTLILRIWLS